jgi:hypothetical protein
LAPVFFRFFGRRIDPHDTLAPLGMTENACGKVNLVGALSARPDGFHPVCMRSRRSGATALI